MIGPRNTISNLGYAAVGTYCAWRFQDASSAALAVALWVLATGSALYHAQKTRLANRLDWVGMYAVCGAIIAHGFLPTVPWVSWAILVGAGAGIAFYGHQRWMQADWHILAAMILGSVGPLMRGMTLSVLAAWGLFAVGYVAWHLDRRRSPLVGVWGHALWHLMTALAIGQMYLAQRGAGWN
jgi:hypothetical protein